MKKPPGPRWSWSTDGAEPVSKSSLTRRCIPNGQYGLTLITIRFNPWLVTGQQTIDGFVLPTRIDLSAESGQRVSVALDRYEANARFEESLFTLAPPSS
jgi:hypothetical protein